MKKIIIGNEGNNQLIINDNDDSELSKYTNDISKILDSSKICILETSSGSVVLKPSKINYIQIIETEDYKKNTSEKDIINNKKEEKRIFNDTDIIKD